MQPPTEKDFNDPALKDAVRRCWACDCASKELHKKITQLCQTAGSDTKDSRALRRISWVTWSLATAACCVLAVGIVHFRESSHSDVSLPGITPLSALPVSLETNLIDTHDHCCRLPNHQNLPVPITDDVGIASALRQKLERPVLMFHPRGPDWRFRGAAVCPVGTIPAEHLVYTHGDEALSVFGLPLSAMPTATEGSEYSGTFDQHRFVGFVKDGVLFCLVGSGPGNDVGVDQLKQMETQMLPAIARANQPQPAPVLLTELLRPIDPQN